jgi:hypothetical protein
MRLKNNLQKILLITIWLLTVHSSFSQTNNCSLEEKYWAYRKRLDERFVKNDYESLKNGYHNLDGIGTPARDAKGNIKMPVIFTMAGNGIPYEYYNVATNGLMAGGDAMVDQGSYLAMLATEYKLLKNAKDTSAKKTLDALFLAIQAIRRVDMSANLFLFEEGKKQNLVQSIANATNNWKDSLGNPIIKTDCFDSTKISKGLEFNGYSGFFYRSDAPYGININKEFSSSNGAYSSLSDNYQKDGKLVLLNGGKTGLGGSEGKFTSVDQIYGIIHGLSMAKTMLTPVTTKDEQFVMAKIDSMMVGYIAEALKKLDFEGCFKNQGKVQGPNTFKYAGILMSIAQKFGLQDQVKAKYDGTLNPDIKAFISHFLNLDDFFKSTCIPKNSFQINHVLRLFSIEPTDFITYTTPYTKIPSHLVNGDDLVALSLTAESRLKTSFGLSAFLMNPKKELNSLEKQSLDRHCEEMTKMLNDAPCCGPSINLNGPSFIATESVPFSPLLKPCIKVEPPDFWKWATTDMNSYVSDCDRPDCLSEKPTDQPLIFNGIDYMLNFNLMRLACGEKLGFGTSTKPNPLKNVGGCNDDDRFFHINGPIEVCLGKPATFTLSTDQYHSSDGSWSFDSKVIKDANSKKNQELSDTTRSKEMHFFTHTIPSNLKIGSTYTVTYNYTVWTSAGVVGPVGASEQKSITKQIKVVNNLPPVPTISDAKIDDNSCTYKFSVACAQCNEKLKTYDYPMESKPTELTIFNENVCGTTSATIPIPAWPEKCKGAIPKSQPKDDRNLKIELRYDSMYGNVWTTSDRIYYNTFHAELIDAFGKSIYQKDYNSSEISINLYDYLHQSGIFYFRIYTNEGYQWTQKVIFLTE